MSWLWREFFGTAPPWEFCCDNHDLFYKEGGSRRLRKLADEMMYACVCRNGHPGWALLMYYAVRLGGHPLLPLPWRWGFRHPYPSWPYRARRVPL